jgi:integrase
MPWNKETFNDEWHRIQRLTKDLAAERPDLYEAWPRRIPFRNARHYCATWWKQKGLDWKEIADFLGHSYQTCLNYYVRKADDAEKRARKLLEND